jgi:hypothetical protein
MLNTNNIMWKTQQVLHKNPQLVPGTLLAIAGSLVIHRHATHENYGHDHIKTFLAMIIIQMLPLVALEMKIISCADPVGLFCKFATPVTLVHAVFLSMRLAMYNLYEGSFLVYSVLGLVASLITLIKGFKCSPLSFLRCRNVWGLVLLSLVAAFTTNAIDSYLNPTYKYHEFMDVNNEDGEYTEPPKTWILFHDNFVSDMVSTANSYIELTAFIPAVWMVYRQDQRVYDDTDNVSTKRKATAFFLFLAFFYMMEDILQGLSVWHFTKAGAIGHFLHFALLCDFAFYVLAHIYNTDKLVGTLRNWLPADLAYDV